MTISDNSVASFHYTLTDSSGQVLDSSEGKEPLSYLHGAGNIIPGLEKHLAGKAVGDKLSVSVPPAEAYGERDERMKIGRASGRERVWRSGEGGGVDREKSNDMTDSRSCSTDD